MSATVLASASVPDGRLICCDPLGIVTGVDPAPEITSAEDPTLHMEDTTPLNIGIPGSPPTAAAPVASLYQTGQIATRLWLALSFAKRRSNAVSYADDCQW